MPFDKEKDMIRGMVAAGNYGWAILALLELIDVTELHCLEQTLKDITEGVKSGKLRDAIREAAE